MPAFTSTLRTDRQILVDLSGNFFGGVLVPVRSMSMFLEAREVVSNQNQFGILTGMTFPLGH